MQGTAVKYNNQDRPEFIAELRVKVRDYFAEKKKSVHANFSMVAKTVFMLSLYFIPLVIMLSGTVESLWVSYLLWFLMALGMAGIGLSIMHDANHGAYSKNQNVNRVLGFLLNLIGAYHITWKIQHNVLHHTYTNIHEHDEDMDNAIMRFSPNQDHKWFYKFQAFYAPFFYGLLSIYKILYKDFDQIITFNKQGLLKAQKVTLAQALIHAAICKIWYFIIALVIPLMILPFSTTAIILGFLMMHFICGFILAMIFQTAHIIEETSYVKAEDDGTIDNNWAIHQLMTTANFGRKSRIFTWLIGGLNYQIEHHLFPNICHVHYKQIAKIVKETADKHNIPYHEHTTFLTALRSHFTMMHKLGKTPALAS